MPEICWSFISAWLLFIVLNRESLRAFFDRPKDPSGSQDIPQNTLSARAVLFEFFVAVPASTGLVLLLRPFLYQYSKALADMTKGTADEKIALYTLLGILSYGFPFTALRDRITEGLKVAFRP